MGRGGNRREERKVVAQAGHERQKNMDRGIKRDMRRSKMGEEFSV